MHPISADSKSLNYTNAGRVHKSRAVARIITSLLLISAAAVTILFGETCLTDDSASPVISYVLVIMHAVM